VETPLLSLREVAVTRGYRALLAGINLDIKPGELWQLTGPNGSGKTSLLRAIAGLIRVGVSGTIDRPETLLFQGHAPGLKGLLTPVENLQSHPGGLIDAESDRVREALAAVGLLTSLNTPVMQLSAGQQRRVGLARLWLSKSSLWLLDEPFTAIDRQGTTLLEDKLRNHCERGGAVVFTSHQDGKFGANLNQLELADYAAR
jgi:heme exporter protein A